MNWLANEFPERCPDREKQHVFATSLDTLSSRLTAVIHPLEWPLWRNKESISDNALFDLLEYIGRIVALPREGTLHRYLEHTSLSFDTRAGVARYRNDVNELLGRGGAAFTMSSSMTIDRLGSPELRVALSALNPATGDTQLDELIEQGRTPLRLPQIR